MKRAWRTRWGGIESIVAAETRGKAAAVTVRAALEVYSKRQVKFAEVHVRRAPEHDAWAAVDATGCCWGEQYLPR